MTRFAARSTESLPPEPSAGSAQLLSLLVVLESLRQQPAPLRVQKVSPAPGHSRFDLVMVRE